MSLSRDFLLVYGRGARCPFCNALLDNLDASGRMKHMNRCKGKSNPYRYSDNPSGRPPTHRRIRSPDKK